MIEASMMVNDQMPEYCTQRAMKILNRHKKSLNGAKILLLGVAYKQDIDDYRESPAIRVFECLQGYGADVAYYDPYIPSIRHGSLAAEGLKALTAEALKQSDLVLVTAAHTKVDYDFVAEHAQLIFDTKNAMKDVKRRDKIELL
jgi:UDP-N-acetyl-D-glucosamine dehydrogenase